MATEADNIAVEPDAECEQLKGELRREHEMYLRALADFDNYRRRVERDQAKSVNRGKRDVLRSLLEVVDGFDRAMPYLSSAPPSTAEGIRAIHRRLLDLLETQRVKPIPTIGERFDPLVHEAVGTVQGGQYPPGTVAEEVQHGYMLEDEVLRPARVKVVP